MSELNHYTCYMKPYIQPFERHLALKELTAVTSHIPLPHQQDHIFHVETDLPLDVLLGRLTYWEQVHITDKESLLNQTTYQVRREATAKLARNGMGLEDLRSYLPFQQAVPLPKHRALRYGPHGIHEYRGKFFPQLVRSLLNVAGIGDHSLVLDPMCGSGTTPVETILMGAEAIGLDLNPLSVLISQAKCESLMVEPATLLQAYEVLQQKITEGGNGRQWFNTLPKRDRVYLEQWFAEFVLDSLDIIARAIQEESSPKCRYLFTVSLSNILRSVSWQKDDDLRVRKEIPDVFDLDVNQIFLSELHNTVKSVLALLYENEGLLVGTAIIQEGNASHTPELLKTYRHQVDAVITSPPYATALPYLDTDRLSLSYLNLLPRSKQRQHDYNMIGNREITSSKRERYWQNYLSHKTDLTDDIITVIDRIDALNKQANIGFRRQNLPALLSHYFFDMRQVLLGFRQMLKPGAPAYVVVGNNHTIAGGKSVREGGERVEIETDHLLMQLGEAVGLTVTEMIPMDMLTSRDIFRKNTGSAETIICFKN